MKIILLLIAAMILTIGFNNKVEAQSTNTSATVTGTHAGAVLIVPMGLSQTTPLHFGTIVLTSTAGGAVILPSNSTALSFTGGVAVTAGNVTSMPSNAAYSVTGTMNETYALTLPSTITITETTAGAATMTISALTARFNGAGANAVSSTLSALGADNFTVGGTLTVPASAVAGIYDGTFNVSVDYN
jgi:Domain of unknown function (DUF4402)